MIDTAYAMAAPQGQAGGDPSGLMAFLPFILVLGVLYFFIMRPQIKQRKTHEEMLKNLKKGDAVITTGGLFGRIVSITDNVVHLEIADKIKIRVSRAYIAGLENPNAPSKSAEE